MLGGGCSRVHCIGWCCPIGEGLRLLCVIGTQCQIASKYKGQLYSRIHFLLINFTRLSNMMLSISECCLDFGFWMTGVVKKTSYSSKTSKSSTQHALTMNNLSHCHLRYYNKWLRVVSMLMSNSNFWYEAFAKVLEYHISIRGRYARDSGRGILGSINATLLLNGLTRSNKSPMQDSLTANIASQQPSRHGLLISRYGRFSWSQKGKQNFMHGRKSAAAFWWWCKKLESIISADAHPATTTTPIADIASTSPNRGRSGCEFLNRFGFCAVPDYHRSGNTSWISSAPLMPIVA